jgi:hypothetical protein
LSTFFHEDIEFVLPGIYKAFPLTWAEEFLYSGRIFFTNIEIFRVDEDPQRGDQLEGTSIAVRQGVRCTAGYLNPIFVWCSTMETDPTVIKETWKDRDAVLQITDILTLIRRIRDAAASLMPNIQRLSVGSVTYDKDEGSFREYYWAEGIFQKNLRYSGQKEFRLALVGDISMKDEENVILELGDCNDIARILK